MMSGLVGVNRRYTILIAMVVGYYVLGGVPGHSATFHVAQNEPGASDKNNGLSPIHTSGSHGPWETLHKAASTATASDTVLIYNGDYRQEEHGYGTGIISINNSGNSQSAKITFAAALKQKPVLNTLRIHGQKWIEISGLIFLSPGLTLPDHWVDMPNIFTHDSTVVIDADEEWSKREPKIRQKFGTYMSIMDYFDSVYTTAIDIKNSEHIIVKDNTISLYTFGIQPRDRSKHITIENNDISRCRNGIYTWRPQPALSNAHIVNNFLHQNFQNGIDVRENAQDIVIENNRIEYSGMSHITVINGVQNSIIRGNRVQFGGYYSETMHYPGSSAINVHSSREGIVVEGNVAAYQIDLTGNDGNGYIADLMLNGAGVVFKNNIAFRNMGAGINTTVSPNSMMVNNSLIENGYNAKNSRNGAGIKLSREQDQNQTILNNIFYNNTTAGIKSYKIILAQKRIDYNLYYAPNGAPFIWDGYQVNDRAYKTIGQIRQGTPWEKNGKMGDPQFVDLSSQNFNVKSTSPAIDAGQTLSEVTNDFNRKSRPQKTSYDIGAVEYEDEHKQPLPSAPRQLRIVQ